MTIKRTTAEELRREREKLACELLAFRQKHLCTQIRLSELLGISRRCLQYAEAGIALPLMSTRAKFLELKREFAEGRGQVA